MADLYPTKARRELLGDVARRYVWASFLAGDHGEVYTATGDGGRQKVTARIEEMRRTGWVRVGGDNPHARKRPYELTDAGRAVLDARGGQR